MKSPREKFLIEKFPDATKQHRIRKIMQKEKLTDDARLTQMIWLTFIVCFLGVLGVLFLVPYGFDTNPLTGLIILALSCTVLFFDYHKRAKKWFVGGTWFGKKLRN